VPPQHDCLPPASSPWVLKSKVTLSHSHLSKLTNWSIDTPHPVYIASTSSKYSTNLPCSQLPRVSCNSPDYGLPVHTIIACKCTSPKLLNCGLQVPLQTRWITASKCICNLTCSQPRSISPDLLNSSLQVCTIAASQWIFRYTWSQYPWESLISVNYGLQFLTIMASNCISPNWVNFGVELNLHSRLIIISERISMLTGSWPPYMSRSSLNCHNHVPLELLSSTTCSQSRYTMCRWVAILIHRYIDTSIHGWEYKLKTPVLKTVEC